MGKNEKCCHEGQKQDKNVHLHHYYLTLCLGGVSQCNKPGKQTHGKKFTRELKPSLFACDAIVLLENKEVKWKTPQSNK